MNARELKRLYVDEGLIIEKLASLFACSATTIRRRMRAAHINARARGPIASREVYVWSSELAYVVGLITSDGNLSGDGRHLSLTSADIDLLETARQCLKLNVHITTTLSGAGKRHFRLQWGSRSFYNWLKVVGLMPAKSLQLQRLNIPDQYMPDFVRGCMDGDGSIQVGANRLSIYLTSGSRPFLEWLHTYMKSKLGVRGGVYVNRGPQADYWRLKYAKRDTMVLLNWMYYSSSVPCLARKRDQAAPFLSHLRP